MSPRDGNYNEGELRKLESIERTNMQKASGMLLQLLRQHHPEHVPHVAELTQRANQHSPDVPAASADPRTAEQRGLRGRSRAPKSGAAAALSAK